MKSIIQFDGVFKTYQQGEVKVHALKDADFQIYEGEFVIIFGASGAGKSTILNILGGIDRPTSGRVVVDGDDISQLSEHELTNFRKEKVGFVFQFYNLIANLTALENVAFASDGLADVFMPSDILGQVGLADKQHHFPSQLSGGEQQRVAIARAVAKRPKFLLCDEPTGALDTVAGITVLNLLEKLNRQDRCTVVLITHNPDLLPMADKVVHVQDGEVREVSLNESRKAMKEMELS
ncbi:MAG TPA: ABC transporter ATP-binding protein [Tissierellia bacterium]|jgi:putative ABC transport system ATP-binding protein|nr:ABC transporter ATP-binding protein [Tissierellia bacterium]